MSPDEKPKPPPIPISPQFAEPNRKSLRKTLQGLIPITPKSPKYPEGLIPSKSPVSPAFVEKGPVVRSSFVPLDCPGKKSDGRSFGFKRRTLIWLWVLGILLILGLSLGLGLGLGLKGLQHSDTASNAPASSSATSILATATASATETKTASTTASSTQTPATAETEEAGKVIKVQQFDQPAFAVPQNAATTTYTVAAATATSGTGFVDCPSSNGTTYVSGGKKFTKLCYTDLPGPGILNLDQMIVNSLEHCVDACAKYSGSKGSCGAVSYSADMNKIVPQQKANCWLKDKSGEPKPGTWGQASAVLEK